MFDDKNMDFDLTDTEKDAFRELHEDKCQCDWFSDCFKDVNGYRPKVAWTCQQIIEWFDSTYKADENGVLSPINGFAE